MKGQDFIKSPKTSSTNAFNDAGAKVSFRPMLHCYLRVRSHERRNELIPVWDFKPAWKQVLFTWHFISAAFQTDPIYRRTCVGVSFRVVFTWYFITRNEILFLSKRPIWNLCPQWVSNAHAYAISNEAELIHFASGKFCSHENLMSVWNFISVKMTDMKSIPVWVSYCIHVNTSKELTEHQIEYFQPKWNLISVSVHFASHVDVLLNTHQVNNY